MVEFSFLFLELIFAAIWLIVRSSIWIKNRHIDLKREAVLLLMYINLAVIIRFTFFTMATVDGHVQPLVFDVATAFPFRVNFIPFVHLFDYESKRDLLLNVIGNTAMFIPSGIVLPIVYHKITSFAFIVAKEVSFYECAKLKLADIYAIIFLSYKRRRCWQNGCFNHWRFSRSSK